MKNIFWKLALMSLNGIVISACGKDVPLADAVAAVDFKVLPDCFESGVDSFDIHKKHISTADKTQ